MHDPEFDEMARRAAGVTRRGALAALAGGALLALPDGLAANDKAKRRRQRKQRQAKRASWPNLRPIWFTLTNHTPNAALVSYGDQFNCCNVLSRDVTIPPFSRKVFSSGFNEEITGTFGFLWINDHYWVSISNLPTVRPVLYAAVGGQPAGSTFCCLPPPAGALAVDGRPLSQGNLTSFKLAGHSFWVARNKDTNYLVFEVMLPATLGAPPATPTSRLLG